MPRGSLSDEPEKTESATDDSDKSPVFVSPSGRQNHESAGDEPSVGEMRAPLSKLPPSMVVRRPENSAVRAELPGSNAVHELP
jgi:hypothetical protein